VPFLKTESLLVLKEILSFYCSWIIFYPENGDLPSLLRLLSEMYIYSIDFTSSGVFLSIKFEIKN
jgi:hypothetical protein